PMCGADDGPRLRAPAQFVAAEGNKSGSLRQRLCRGRLVRQAPTAEIDERPTAEILNKGYFMFASKRSELCRWCRGGKSLDRIVAGVRLEDQTGPRSDRCRKIGEVGAVGRADLEQPSAGARHDAGQSKRAADLDQLAARHDRLAPFGQCIE